MITANELLQRGYFPRELPPSFTTAPFAAFIASSRGTLKPVRRSTQCVGHNLARPGGLRRSLKIPNPFPYFALCEQVERHGGLIWGHLTAANLSATRPRVTKALGRAVVPRLRLGELPTLRARRWRGMRYLLRTDISQFYPSIYTHSIPWALHTKPVAKANIGKAHLPGDDLDHASRSQQWGQTVGIPIGPDTSLIIAEVILSAVDKALHAHHPPLLRGFRYLDDYELAFRNLAEAEAVLVELQGGLAEYELTLNPRKTEIVEMPVPLEEAWVLELSRFPIRATPRGQASDIVALFSRAFEFAAQHREHAVLRYAIMRVRGEPVAATAWRTFENVILNAVTAEPSALPAALGVLATVSAKGGHKMNKRALADVIEAVVLRHAPLAHGSEVVWCLWASLSFGLQLSADVAQAVAQMDDDAVALVALDADSRGLFPRGTLNPGRWAAIVASPDAAEAEHWLLAYEAQLRGWLNAPAVARDREFSQIAAAGVSFYDPAAAGPGFPAAGFSAPGGTLAAEY